MLPFEMGSHRASVSVSAHEKLAAHTIPLGIGWVQLRVPCEVDLSARPPRMRVQFWVENPTSPSQLGVGNDSRMLGFKLRSAQLEVAAHSPRPACSPSPPAVRHRASRGGNSAHRVAHSRQKRLVAEISVEEDDLPQDQGLPPAAAADAALLQRALEALPAATRSVLWLYHAEGYTHEEIAGLMQRTPSFSKSQVSRGTRRLRALLNIEDTVHA